MVIRIVRIAMKIFLDFDDVLFDTGRFREDLQEVFARRGISREVFTETYRALKEKRRGIQTYDFDRHLERLHSVLRYDERALREDVDTFVSGCGRYLFDDVSGFLERCKLNGAEVYVVSYGTYSFQEKKVRGSGIGAKVAGVVAGDIHKGVAVRELLDGEKAGDAWFLDDRAYYIDHVEEENPEIHTILVTRSEGRYHDEKTEKCDFQVKSLKEASKIIFSE